MYRFLKTTIGFLLKQFFAEIKVRGFQKLEDGPVLVVVNHPNMALDSLLVADSFDRDLWFVAKATLFTQPLLRRFFNACHMLPVQRRQDSTEGAVDNRETFSKVVEKLCANGAVVIFPEGVSLGERKLMPLKTGAARMAFEAEESKNFNLGLKIQAVGITYSKLESFKGSVTLTFAEPVLVSEYKKDYEKDAQNAVKVLTERIANELNSVTVTVENEKHIELVEKISAIFRSKDADLDDRSLMQAIASNVRRYSDNQLSEKKSLLEKVDIYTDLASMFAVDGGFALENKLNGYFMTAAMPLFFLAYLINVIPYRLVGSRAGSAAVEPVYRASSKFGYGILLFTAWYLLLSLVVSLILKSCLAFFLSFIVCILSGYYLNKYLNYISLFIISSVWPVNKKPLDLLRIMRDDLISELNASRVE